MEEVFLAVREQFREKGNGGAPCRALPYQIRWRAVKPTQTKVLTKSLNSASAEITHCGHFHRYCL
eukprot:802109-Amphidinium_carterae.1